MERLLGIRRIYKPLWWVLVAFFALSIVVPLVQRCVIGLFQGESCDRQRIVDFVVTYYPWMLAILVLLGGLLFVSWRAQRNYLARQPFELMKPVSKLLPEDLRFHVVERGDSEIEEVVAQDQRPYHEHAYVPRTAVDYAARGSPDPRPRYTEEELVELLRSGKGFTLQGQPTDGKSRTIYEVIRRMDGYHVVSPKKGDLPGDEDIGLLLKGREIVLLLDDLTNYVGAGLDLRELGRSLNRNQVSWVVASTCRDGPELESVRNAQTEGLGTFYEDIPLKLKLMELTVAEKEMLAQNVGREWASGESEQYPTPGSIAMENYKRFMHERFERNLSPVQRDTLRALKLLSSAGILPITHSRVVALLEDDRLFDWRDVHLQRDCLDGLRDNSFTRRAPDREVVQPEPAYLTDDVVPYTEGKEPNDDFADLADVLESLKDHEGLLFLGHIYSLFLEDDEQALACVDRAIQIRADYVEALFTKVWILSKLGRNEEALEASKEVLNLNPESLLALTIKGEALLRLGRPQEALEASEEALKLKPDSPEALIVKAAALWNCNGLMDTFSL